MVYNGNCSFAFATTEKKGAWSTKAANHNFVRLLFIIILRFPYQNKFRVGLRRMTPRRYPAQRLEDDWRQYHLFEHAAESVSGSWVSGLIRSSFSGR